MDTASDEARYSSGASGTTLIDHPSSIHPKSIRIVLLPATQSTLVRKGPLQQLGVTEQYFLGISTVIMFCWLESEQKVVQSVWSQVGVSVNEENSTIELFINGESALTSEIPEGLSADLSDSLFWLLVESIFGKR